MKFRLLTDKRGALTVEAAVILPFLIAAFLVCFGLIDTYFAYNCASGAMYKTAQTMSKYAVVYHTNGIKKLTDAAKEKLGDGINLGKVSEYLNTDSILRFGTDKLYSFAADKVFESCISDDEVYQKYFKGRMKWSFSESSFFHANDDINLTGEFTCDYNIPFIGGFLKGFSFKKNVCVASFGTGKSTVSTKDGGDSIWSMNNFDRGKKLEELFGGNLPNFFPVIDYYNNGMVMSIVSLNHTTATYQSSGALRKKLDDAARKLYEFNGAEYKGTVVRGESIFSREIKLVCPEDEFSASQAAVIENFTRDWNAKGIRVTVERYQKTVQIDTDK